jgi:hypothetical protein
MAPIAANFHFRICSFMKFLLPFASLILMFPASGAAALKLAAALPNDLGQVPIRVESSLPSANVIRLD